MTYRQSFFSYEKAQSFCDTLIYGGIIQQQGTLWHVWQMDASSSSN